jgi:hypothetical protein
MADVRLAHGREARRLEIQQDALATSALSEYLHNENSSTVYPLSPARGLDESFTISAIAGSCLVADALTKVGWFGAREALSNCVQKFGAQVLIFDRNGAMAESFE